MKYQAKIENGTVTQVIVATNEVVLEFDGEWISCSEQTLPSIGYTYTETEGFRPPKPFGSWVYNSETKDWEPPIPYPDDGNIYEWSEETQTWKLEYLKA